jgi:uncharacterized protein YozE (UPF0346 family)
MEAMPRPVVYPPLRNWQDFEDLCLDLWRRLWNDPHAQKNGRSGQPQAGVDVFGRPDGGTEWAGVQCKRFDEGSLTPKVVREEVAKARKFKPALSRYVIATTAPSDVHCQKAARKITDHGFPVTVVSWEEICHYLEEHPDLVERYFGIPAAQGKGGDASAESRGIAVAGDVKNGVLISGDHNQVTIVHGQTTTKAATAYPCKVARPDGFVPRQELDKIRQILCGDKASAVGITTALRGRPTSAYLRGAHPLGPGGGGHGGVAGAGGWERRHAASVGSRHGHLPAHLRGVQRLGQRSGGHRGAVGTIGRVRRHVVSVGPRHGRLLALLRRAHR